MELKILLFFLKKKLCSSSFLLEFYYFTTKNDFSYRENFMYVTLFSDAQLKFEKSQISLSKSHRSIQTESPIEAEIGLPNVGEESTTLSVF